MTCPICSAPVNDPRPQLPCGHAAINLMVLDGVVLGCLECQNRMAYDLIMALEEMTPEEILEREG
jgi:hypothetical protein